MGLINCDSIFGCRSEVKDFIGILALARLETCSIPLIAQLWNAPTCGGPLRHFSMGQTWAATLRPSMSFSRWKTHSKAISKVMANQHHGRQGGTALAFAPGVTALMCRPKSSSQML